MKQFVLDHLSNACTTAQNIAGCRADVKGADMYIDLDTGKTVAVYIINRAIRLPEIEETFESNTARKIHTLFIVDGRMMPENSTEVEPPYWMAALHAAGHGRVYAYWCEGRSTTIRPVHMEWKWGGVPRTAEYGPAIDVNKLRTGIIELNSKYINGRYAMADFNDAAFWKKHEKPADQQQKYSWRQWTYGKTRKQADEQTQRDESKWDAWEEFAKHYGQTGSYGPSSGYTNYQRARRRSEQAHQQRTTEAIVRREHYAILGVSATATYDEVKQAYRQKARENHPDLHPQEKQKYTEKMANINAAFEAISKKLK
jgi:hypothetical protein